MKKEKVDTNLDKDEIKTKKNNKVKKTKTKQVKEKSPKVKRSKKENKGEPQKSKSTKEVKKVKRRKLNKLNVFVVILSMLFVIAGVFGILIGTGVITFSLKEKGPILYPLSEKVNIGDYVDYNAGSWEEDKDIPNRASAFTLGGYQKAVSRNDGVTCNYNDISNKGWRVFSVEEDKVTLIQSGISMCYYHGYGSSTNDKSVNILSGNDENIKFDFFLDNKFSEDVRILSKEDIDKFIDKDSSYNRIEDDLIAVGNPYWLATKNGSYYMWYVTEGGTVASDHVGSYGVRVLVTLKKNVKTVGQNDKKVWQLTEEIKKDE